MSTPTQNYRFGKMVVEVRKIHELAHKYEYICLVRSFGHKDIAPRQSYDVVATTNAQAARIAIGFYRRDYGEEKQGFEG